MVTLGSGFSSFSGGLAGEGAKITRLHIINTTPKTKIGNIESLGISRIFWKLEESLGIADLGDEPV